MDTVICYLHISSDLTKSRTCIITDLIFRKNASAYFGREWGEGRKSVKHIVKRIIRYVSTIPTRIGFDTGGVLKKTADRENFQNTKRTSDLKAFQRSTDILDITK